MKINNGYSIESIMSQIKGLKSTSADNPFDTTIEDTEALKVQAGETIEQTELLESLDAMGIEVTEGELKEIETFMAESEGTVEEKLETIKSAKELGIDLSQGNLKAVDEALHNPLSDVKLPQGVLNGKLSEEKLERFMKFLNVPDDVKTEALSLLESGDIKSALASILNAVSSEGQVSETLLGDMSEEALLFKIVETFEQIDLPVLEMPEGDAMTLDLGDIFLGTEDDEEVSLLESLEEMIDQVMSEMVSQEMPIQSMLETPVLKQYLVTETTEKMIEVKASFSEFQKETIESLKPFVEGEAITKAELEQVMTKAIDKLDSVLMKSEIPLYTSMKDEKKLILMSSDLQEAKKLVAKGDYTEAKTIMKAVSSSLNEMVFNPQKRHVQGFVKDTSQLALKSDDFYYEKSDVQMSARGVHEYLRDLGLNYDSEVAEKILSENKSPIKDNLKQVLLELKETFENEDDEKLVTAVEKNLNNLNGQQLLNKEPQKNQEQTLHLNIPIVLADEMKDLKLYVQSRDANNKMDWENCTLYFAVDSGNYGKTGIRIKVQNRATQVQVINEHEDFKEKVAPLIEDMFSNLTDVGFIQGDTSYKDSEKDLDPPETPRQPLPKTGYESFEKRLDIKI